MEDVIDVDATSPPSSPSPSPSPTTTATTTATFLPPPPPASPPSSSTLTKRTVVDLVDVEGEDQDGEEGEQKEEKVTPPTKRARRDSEGSSTEEFLPSTDSQDAMQQETIVDQQVEQTEKTEQVETNEMATEDIKSEQTPQQQRQQRVYHVVEIQTKGSYRLFELPEDVLSGDDVSMFEQVQFAGAATTDEEVQDQTRARSHVVARIGGFPPEYVIAKTPDEDNDNAGDKMGQGQDGKKREVVVLLGTFIVNV